jgi:DnaK suppressor protein
MASGGTADLDLSEVEKDLRARLAETHERIAELTKPPEAGSTVGFGKRIGDGTTEAISRFTDVGVANDLHAIEERIERALAKLEEGTYGVCDECGGEIVAGRLKAAPESALCIECAREAR